MYLVCIFLNTLRTILRHFIQDIISFNVIKNDVLGAFSQMA